MGERVRIEYGGGYRVYLDDEVVFSGYSGVDCQAFLDGLRMGLESASPGIVADTARALDETLDSDPAPRFKVGDRVVDIDGDVATVVGVDGDEIDVLYDDRDFGKGGRVTWMDSGYISPALTALAPAVTPHPDRPATADGRIPEGWREDCYGSVFAPGGGVAEHVDGHWFVYVHGRWQSPPVYFYLRSEAIARLRELLAEGGE